MYLKPFLLLIGLLIVVWSAYQLDCRKNQRKLEEARKRKYQRWKGSKTDERINGMLQESIVLLKGLGVPISESICPEVTLKGAHVFFGRCCTKGSFKNYTEYDFYIEVSGYILNNSEKSLRNTLIHELIHTVPGGLCHTGAWKKWAVFVSKNTEYHISYRGNEDDTEQDLKNLRYDCADL